MRLNGPEQMIGVRSLERWAQRATAIRRRLDLDYEDGVFIARVEQGRWLADCVCGSGVAVHPEWPSAGCLECGRWWPVSVPINWQEIEDVLLARPNANNRGWFNETIEQLEAENVSHGVPTRPRRRTAS